MGVCVFFSYALISVTEIRARQQLWNVSMPALLFQKSLGSLPPRQLPVTGGKITGQQSFGVVQWRMWHVGNAIEMVQSMSKTAVLPRVSGLQPADAKDFGVWITGLYPREELAALDPHCDTAGETHSKQQLFLASFGGLLFFWGFFWWPYMTGVHLGDAEGQCAIGRSSHKLGWGASGAWAHCWGTCGQLRGVALVEIVGSWWHSWCNLNHQSIT